MYCVTTLYYVLYTHTHTQTMSYILHTQTQTQTHSISFVNVTLFLAPLVGQLTRSVAVIRSKEISPSLLLILFLFTFFFLFCFVFHFSINACTEVSWNPTWNHCTFVFVRHYRIYAFKVSAKKFWICLSYECNLSVLFSEVSR